jgi:pantothenate kinase
VTPERLVDPCLDELVERARSLVVPGQRRVLGIAGPPGAGKSTLAAAVRDGLGSAVAALVPMDGFHLPNERLAAMGLRDRKGAPETFAGARFVATLARVRASYRATVLVPAFDRDADAVVTNAIEIAARIPLIVTEGNYLLLDDAPWASIRHLLDAAWYLRGDGGRVPRLIARHVSHGRTLVAASDWVLRSDEANAARIASSEARADLVIDGLPGSAPPSS